jgi:glycosyltransferase involved in cell wall biosynthesis
MRILSLIKTKNLSYGGPISLLNSQKNDLKDRCQIIIMPTDRLNFWLLVLILCGFKKKNFFYKFDIIHFHDIWNYKSIIIAHILKKNSIPFLFSLHGLFDIWSFSKNFIIKKIIYFLLLKSLFLKNSCLQVSTQKEFEEAKVLIKAKNFFLLPNGVNLNYFNNNNPKTINRNKISFVFFGRLHQKKGIEILLLSFSKLITDPAYKQIQFELKIIGPGTIDYINRIKNLVKKSKLQNSVKILNPIFNVEKKINFLKKEDFFILPSFEEADSVALKEALALGLPVIISEQCRLEDVEMFNCGLIAKTNILDLFLKFKEILNKDYSHMSLNAINLIKNKYNSKIINDNLYTIYLDTLHGTRFSKQWIRNNN